MATLNQQARVILAMEEEDAGGGGPPAVLENLLLAVASWWVGRHNRAEVLDLLTRHYLPVDMYQAHLELAQVCPQLSPGTHKNSQTRTAGEAYAIDLYNNLLQLSNEKKLPRLLLSSDDLGKVPLGALSVSNERSVSARLESLESCVSKVTIAMEKMCAKIGTPGVPSVPAPQAPPIVPQVVVSDWASVAAAGDTAQGDSIAAALEAGRGRAARVQQAGLQDKIRDRSSSATKRKAPGEDEDGFRKPGRPRKTAGGSSKVELDDLGECQPNVQYYISNTPGHSTADLIKKVLEKCSAPLLEGKAILTVHKVELLTKEEDPRTRCWKVMVS